MGGGKPIWIVPLLTAAAVALAGWWADGQLRRVTEREVRANLAATLDANVTALDIWIGTQKRVAQALADEPRFRAAALEVLAAPPATNQLSRLETGTLVRQLLTGERFLERAQSLGFAGVLVLHTNFTIAAGDGRGRGRAGGPVPEELHPKYREALEQNRPVLVTPFKPPRPELFRRNAPPGGAARPRFARNTNAPPPFPRNASVMQVAAPIRDNVGAVRGLLVFLINPDAEFSRMLSVARPGETGETLAFDAEGVMLSESRFDPALRLAGLIENRPDSVSALNVHLRDPGGPLADGFRPDTNSPLMRVIERALTDGEAVELEPFRDYRGEPVVGAARWLPQYGFGVTAKVDAQEAFHSRRVVRGVFLLVFCLLLLATLMILAFTYSHVLWRRRLTEAELKARQLGQYRLLEKIGEGGMGTVFKARHALLRRETALKLLPPDKADPYAIQRFEQEVQLTCRLAHPNTIQIYDYGHTPDGIFYYVMEYLEGLNLAELVAAYGPQPEARVIHILRQVCGSLAEAHAHGLLHRDIKPANVFLTDRGGVPDQVKVLDFGLVRHFGPGADEKNLKEFVSADGIIGTPNFIAPEAIQDPAAADARSDLYSVGVLGYYLLTGTYIFEGATIAEVCRRHLSELPPPPSARCGRALAPDLENLLMRCLAKNPADRPQTAEELAALLTGCAAAADWTAEQRAAWWAAHRRRVVAPAPPGKPASTLPQHTVRIDFEERTP
ncbi:MAG: serine/threonine protein kinase [Limisphaerales bacterium]